MTQNILKKSNKIFVFANKSRNIYELGQEEYEKLLKENITKTIRNRILQNYII